MAGKSLMRGGQSRRHSAFEAIVNVVVGYGLAVATQAVVFPWFGVTLAPADNLAMGLVFTAVSLARSYAIRRIAEAWRLSGPDGIDPRTEAIVRLRAALGWYAKPEAYLPSAPGGPRWVELDGGTRARMTLAGAEWRGDE